MVNSDKETIKKIVEAALHIREEGIFVDVKIILSLNFLIGFYLKHTLSIFFDSTSFIK